MNSDNRLINKAFVGIWAINGVSMLFSIACIMIDAILTGQFLGKEAVAASGLVQPVIMLLNIVGGLFGPGLSIMCTRYMGMARKDLVNRVFSIIMEVTLVTSVFFALLLYVLAPTIANTIGAGAQNPVIVDMMRDYLRGFSLAVLPMWFSLALSGLMMVDNDRVRGMAGMVTVLLSDFTFDYLNVAVFHGGMLGMAIATALSYLLGFIVILTHFTKKDRVLKFSLTPFDSNEIKEVMRCSVTSSISLGSVAVRGIIFNSFLLTVAGTVAVAAFSGANSLFSVINAILLGTLTTTSALVSMLFGEEDRSGIIKAANYARKFVLAFMGVLTVLLLMFAGIFARAFLDASATAEIAQAAVFIRFLAVQNMFNAITFSQSGVYQGTRKNMLSNIIAFLREAACPIISCLVFGSLFGLLGFELGLVFAGILTFMSCYIIPSVIRKKPTIHLVDMILLPDDFGAKPEDLFEASISTMEEVVEASDKAMDFCLKKNIDKRTAHMTGLFIEETVGNAMNHKSGKEVLAEIRVIHREDAHIIRIRDNGKQFDPVKWYEQNHPEDPSSGLGIRMIMKLAKDVDFIPALGLNNLMITL